MRCPICSAHMQHQVDAGDPDAGYGGGTEHFLCTNEACELGKEWHDTDEVEAAVEAHAHEHSGGQAA